MLTLTVKEGQYIKIGDNIFVKYSNNVKTNSISLSIEAPKEIPITRSEVYERSLEEKAKKNPEYLPELEKAKRLKGKYVKAAADGSSINI